MDEAGVPTYDELVLVANEDALERDAGRIRAFIGALARGTRELEQDPDKASRGCSTPTPISTPSSSARS